MSEFDDFWGKPISVYSRQMAISDGTLIELNVVAKEVCNQMYPGVSIVVTSAVWNDIEKAVANPSSGNDINGVVWDIFSVMREPLFNAIKRGEVQVDIKVIITGISRRTLQFYKVVADVCDDGKRPALTIMMPGED